MRKFIPYLLGLLIVGGAAAYYMYNKPHKEAADIVADYTMAPADLMADYDKDEAAADAAYLDKVIALEGVVASVNELEKGASLSLETGSELSTIMCEFESKEAMKGIQPGQKIKVKGFCTGKLMDVVLVRCVIEE